MTKINERTREIAHELLDVILDTAGAAEIEALVALLPGDAREKLSDLLAPMVQTMVVGDVAYSTAVKGWDGLAADTKVEGFDPEDFERALEELRAIAADDTVQAFADSLSQVSRADWASKSSDHRRWYFRKWEQKTGVN